MSLLSRIQHHLESQSQVTAAWLAGSRGRGTADDLSDIDIWVAVEDDAIGAIIADPLAFVHESGPTLMHIQAPSIAPSGGVFLLTWMEWGDGFEQVDWYWTPASTATRPSQTRILFERLPVPVVDSPALDRLDDEARDAEIDGAIGDSLLLIAYAWKHVRRGDPWRTVAHIQHANDCLAKLDWLVIHGRPPGFHDPKRSFLPDAVPIDRGGVRTALRCLVDDLASLVDSADRMRQHREVVAKLSLALLD